MKKFDRFRNSSGRLRLRSARNVSQSTGVHGNAARGGLFEVENGTRSREPCPDPQVVSFAQT